MNDEQSRRLAEAADAIIGAGEAIEEARASTDDSAFGKELERERAAAAQRMASRIEAAARKTEDALRKATVAAATVETPNAWSAYRDAVTAIRAARTAARSAPDADGSANRRDMGGQAVERLTHALTAAAAMTFKE